ncbi:MAG: hypothetical protein KQ78_02034 [Candidatus Izimaplasma bacterium HR2]|nr:MAG: hypothetical protein KQ78_02034 [Candidatus Izimaplasma bacterium HR2]
MIREFKLSNIEQCIKLIKNVNKGIYKDRFYPIDEEGIQKRLIKRHEQSDVKVLLYFDNNEVTGVLELLIDNDEKYLQILVIFVDGDVTNKLDKYFGYIKNEYSAYKLHYVLSDYNTNYISYMEKLHAKSDGYETMINIKYDNFIGEDSSNVIEMSKEHHNEFIQMHNKMYPGAFWTGELLLKEDSRFEKYVILENEKLVGYSITSNLGRTEEEIYFVHSYTLKQKEELINKSLINAFKRADSVQLLLDIYEAKDIDNYKKIGFKEKEIIITYLLDSI